jgi:hypothetical protein
MRYAYYMLMRTIPRLESGSGSLEVWFTFPQVGCGPANRTDRGYDVANELHGAVVAFLHVVWIAGLAELEADVPNLVVLTADRLSRLDVEERDVGRIGTERRPVGDAVVALPLEQFRDDLVDA